MLPVTQGYCLRFLTCLCLSTRSNMFDLETFPKNGISLLYLPRFVAKTFSKSRSRWVRASDKGTRQIDLVVRNNGAGQKVYRLEGSTQELPYDDRKVAEHMTMACNWLNKSRERRQD
jgi:hypothetical protein